jgi:[ribosomal protein S5]-alanine N-acetyltransferase
MDRPILTERLRLRPFSPDDLQALHALWSDPVVGRWVGGVHTELRESADELGGHLRHQERHGFSLWAVEERESGELVGEIGLQLFEGRGPEVEIGWAVSAAGRRRGIAYEAASRWMRIGFEDLRLDRIIAVVLPGNLVSRRLCERLGMHEEGTRRAYGHPHVVYAAERLRAA